MTRWDTMGPKTPLLTIVETRAYLARAEGLLSEEEREAVKVEIAAAPERGIVIQGTGGVRKMRFAVGNRGRSAGVRVIYYFHNETIPAFLLAVFAKSEKANLSKAERNDLAKLVRILRETYAMPSKAFDAIAAGLEDAIAYAKGDISCGAASHHATEQIDVAAVRRKTLLSQAEFARKFGLNRATLVKWEQGQWRPTGAARVLLKLIDRDPKAVLDALAA